jgi:hypothetical protein
MGFRCSVASLDREEPALGSASTVRAFLLVENDGPWGVDALRDSRLPDGVKDGLSARARAAGVRVLLMRRHRAAGPRAGIRVLAAYADPVAPWLETTTAAEPEVLLELDLESLGRGESPGLTASNQPVFAVCTHGRHDACCAELGRPTAAALAASHPDQTWEVSHVGGDRFAANVLVLPDGLYYGRVSAAAAPALADRHLQGHLDLDLLRGRSSFAMPVQVAEVAVRRETGETRRDGVRVVSVTRSGDETTVAMSVEEATYDVVVRRSTSTGTALLTCKAVRENPLPAYDVAQVRAR